MIKISRGEITETPFTFEYTDEQLIAHAEGKKIIQFPDIPNHSLNCERAVQHVSQAAKLVIGHEKRHTNLLCTMANRNKYSIDGKKSDFME